MFYADFVLSKKGPLARIWLAAHWDAKLTKAQIFETNIESSIERILRPKVKLALRTSGHLMLGVVRIYSRKTKYLLADCNEAFVKIKMAFRPGMVDLPEDHREAAVNAVTLPEIFHDFDLAMPDLNDFDIEAQFTLNQSRAEEITIKEYNIPDSNAIEEEVGSFNNKGFDNDASHISYSGFDPVREGSLGASMQGDGALVENDIAAMNKNKQSNINISDVDYQIPAANSNDCGLFEDPPDIRNISSKPSTSKVFPELEVPLNDDDFGFDYLPPSPGGGSSIGSRPASPIHAGPSTEGGAAPNAVSNTEFLPPMDLNDQPDASKPALESEPVEENVAGIETEQTTLLQNEEESFALAPVNASALKGLTKTKRKRKLIVDEIKSISGEEMKAHLNNTSDIVVTLDLAPPTKRLMRWNETGGVEKLFSLPGRCIPSTILTNMYQRHLSVRAAEGCEDRDAEVRGGNALQIAAPSTVSAAGRRGRKRKQLVEQEEQIADVHAQEARKTPRMSPQFNDLPTISEEPLPNDAILANQEATSAAALPLASPASVPPVTINQNNQHLPSPYPEQEGVTSRQHENQQKANVDNLFSCGETAADSLFQGNQDISLNAATVNMGYDGQDQAVPNEDQNQTLFNFNEDLEHNPVTPGLNTDGGITPWHDTEYDNPVSVGPPVEERGADETVEQFEERILNKRAGQLYNAIKTGISIGTVVSFSDVVCGNARKQVAQKFYSLLVLKKHKILELTQEVPYGTIRLSKGSNFDAPKI